MLRFDCYLLAVFLLLSTVQVKAQLDNKKYDKKSFLVGTLDEYNGYKRVFVAGIDDSNYNKVDIYTQDQLKFGMFIDSLFRRDHSDIYITGSKGNDKDARAIRLKSGTLSAAIEDYYNWKPSRFKTEDINTTDMDSVYLRALNKEKRLYSGVLKKEKFETDKKKISFILGVYLRYGTSYTEMEGEGYRVVLFNAPAKAGVFSELLMDCGFKNVKYTFKRGNIPTPHIITFDVTPELKPVIDEAEKLRNYISGFNTNDIEFAQNSVK